MKDILVICLLLILVGLPLHLFYWLLLRPILIRRKHSRLTRLWRESLREIQEEVIYNHGRLLRARQAHQDSEGEIRNADPTAPGDR